MALQDDEVRALEEGLARSDTQVELPVSPTATFCGSELLNESEKEIGRKYSEGGDKSRCDVPDEKQSNRCGWPGLWRKRQHSIPHHPDEERRPELQVRSRMYTLPDVAIYTSKLPNTVERFPEGYPNLAAFQDSDESFMIYRRFGYLQARVLLAKQDELRVLEEELDALDAEDVFEYPDALFERLSSEGHSADRRQLLSQIERKYLEYG